MKTTTTTSVFDWLKQSANIKNIANLRLGAAEGILWVKKTIKYNNIIP